MVLPPGAGALPVPQPASRRTAPRPPARPAGMAAGRAWQVL